MSEGTTQGPRVFVGTWEIAGIMRGLTCSLRAAGFHADLFLLQDHGFAYETIENNTPSFFAWRDARQALNKPSSLEEALIKVDVMKEVTRLFLEDILHAYDVFIFNGWQSIVPDCSDLALLKRAGKKVITFLLGSEARPQWMQGSLNTKPMEKVLHHVRFGRNKLRLFEQNSDCIVSHPPYSQFLTQPFYPILSLGIPFAPPATVMEATWPETPVIVHAPSSPYKGTARILHAVQTLKDEGLDFTFVSLSGQPNSVVLENLARCTFVLDELYSDSLLAGLGTETAYFGKPTLVGSLPDSADMLLGMNGRPLPPCEVFHDGDPLPGMRRLLHDKAYAQELGARAKAYVTDYWNPTAIGAKLARLIAEDLPASEYCRPEEIRYFRGWGLSDKEFRMMVGNYIRTYGPEALFLGDKPELLRALLRWLKL